MKKIFKNKVVRIAAAAAFAYFGAPFLAAELGFTGGSLAIAKGAIGGFGAGLIGSGGDLRAAVLGGLTGAAFGAVGNYFDGLALENIGPFDAKLAYLSSTQQFAKVVAHGAVGGAASKVSGGSFQDGFLGAGVAQFGAGAIGAIQGPSIIRVVAAAAVGGTASALGGGKFANGAVTAAFGRLFNDEAHRSATRALRSDATLSWDPPMLNDDFANAVVGFGDDVFAAITAPARLFGLSVASLGEIRDALQIEGQIDVDSLSYGTGQVAGVVTGGAALYGGAAFRYVPALGPSSSFIGHPAYGGRTVSSLRTGLKFGWGRGGSGPILRGAYRNRKIDIHRN